MRSRSVEEAFEVVAPHNQTAPLEEAKSPLLKVQQSHEVLQSAFLKTSPSLKKVLPKLEKLR